MLRVSIIHCCVTNHRKLIGLKQQLFSPTVLCVDWAQAGSSCLGFLRQFSLRWWLGLELSEGFHTEMSSAWAVVTGSAGSNQASLSMWPLHTVGLGFFIAWSLMVFRLVWWLAVSRVSVPRAVGGDQKASCDLALQIPQCHFCHILLLK